MEYTKTHYIVFGNKSIDGKVSVLINSKIIDRVYELKCQQMGLLS